MNKTLNRLPRKGMNMSDDLKDDALLWLTIIVVLLTVHEILTGYQIGQRTDFIQQETTNKNTG